jgi:hypothetical protein
MAQDRPQLSMAITPELIEEMKAYEKRLELLKQTDPAEYERIMEPQETLRRWLNQVREAHHRKQ